MLDFARHLTLPSAAAYGLWRLGGRGKPVRLELRSGPRIELRPDTAGNADYGAAYEVFVHDYYRPPPAALDPRAVRLVVDLGTNVGFSALRWLSLFPDSRVIAFEPHPGHAAQARRNLALSSLADRVELHDAAAGARARRSTLSDEGMSSTLAGTGQELNIDGAESGRGLSVEVVDVFPLLLGRRIDVLKIDIEGGEYELFEDLRFAALDIGAVVMEWHTRGAGPEDRRWCEERLRAMGFSIETLFATGTHGMFWALRNGGSPAAASAQAV